jgi:hypothetical protein
MLCIASKRAIRKMKMAGMADGIQKVSGGAMATGWFSTYLLENATQITLISTMATTVVFLGCTIWNAHTKSKMYRLNIKILMAEVKADIIANAMKEGATDEEVERIDKLIGK